jgi:hypothetical protein
MALLTIPKPLYPQTIVDLKTLLNRHVVRAHTDRLDLEEQLGPPDLPDLEEKKETLEQPEQPEQPDRQELVEQLEP